MKNLRFVSVQPANNYYAWQVEVMINNFIKNEIHPNFIDIICSIKNDEIPENWKKLRNHYNNVRFFFYNDTRENPCYISSIRPHVLQKHFEAHPYLKNEAIFYHDCDIILTKPVDFNHLLDDNIWYLSDTKGYISAEYIKSKGFGVYERMCEIIGIDQSIPEHYNDTASGGAQYLMKNIDAQFWEKVYNDSEKLYQFFLDHLKVFPEGCLNNYHPIQKWTADMWAVLWNAWYFKHETLNISDMEFAWPMNDLDMWRKCNILHNAGVTEESSINEKLFYKGKYVNGKLPYDINVEDYAKNKCTYKYVESILETATHTCLL